MSQLNIEVDKTDDNDDDYHRIEVILESQEEGGYTVLVPEILEIVTEGETEDQAIDNFLDAFKELLQSYMKHEEELPFEMRNNFFFEFTIK